MKRKFVIWWREWRLRKAKEKHAMWKGRREEYERQFIAAAAVHDVGFLYNPYNRNRAIDTAGQEAKYLERVEDMLRTTMNAYEKR